jgi:hypothetical protein
MRGYWLTDRRRLLIRMSYTKDAIVIAFWVILIGVLIVAGYALSGRGYTRYVLIPIVIFLIIAARARISRQGLPSPRHPKYTDEHYPES